MLGKNIVLSQKNTKNAGHPKAETIGRMYREGDTKQSPNIKFENSSEKRKWEIGFDIIDTSKDGILSSEEICDYRDKQVTISNILNLVFFHPKRSAEHWGNNLEQKNRTEYYRNREKYPLLT